MAPHADLLRASLIRAAVATFRLPKPPGAPTVVVRVRTGIATTLPAVELTDPALFSVIYPGAGGTVSTQAKLDFLESAGDKMQEWEGLSRLERHTKLIAWAKQSTLGWLRRSGYNAREYPTTTVAQIAGWSAAEPIGVLFWHAHGVTFQKKDGSTTAGLVTGEQVTDALENGAYKAMRDAGEVFMAKDGKLPPALHRLSAGRGFRRGSRTRQPQGALGRTARDGAQLGSAGRHRHQSPVPAPAGNPEVLIRNQFHSNQVPFTRWSVPFSYVFRGPGSLTYQVEMNVRIFGDVHGSRGFPEQEVQYLDLPFGSLDGNIGQVSASGSYQPEPDEFISWSSGTALTSVDHVTVTGATDDTFHFRGTLNPTAERIDQFSLVTTGHFTETTRRGSLPVGAPVLGLTWPPPSLELISQTSALVGDELSFDFPDGSSAGLSWPTVIPQAAPHDLTVR